MTNEVIPFGKYRGQPIEAMAADRQYLDWLIGQDWFRERHQNLYTIVINNFGEPEETPEHNRLQARFLDKEFAKKVIKLAAYAKIIKFKSPDEYATPYQRVENPIEELTCEFEVRGADVEISNCTVHLNNIRTRTTNVVRHLSMGTYNDGRIHVMPAIRVEIKPSMGDDYPAVLRQMQAVSSNTLLIDQYTGSGATLDQMTAMFAASGIVVIPLSVLET